MPQPTPLSLSLPSSRFLFAAACATLVALLALLATPAAAQPPSTLACDTDVSNIVAAVTGSSGNGGNPNTLFFVDATSGQTTSITTTPVVPNHLAYDWNRQLFYFVDHSGQALYAYDLNSGVTTLIDSDITSIPGTGDMPAGFTGHDAGTFWNNRYYIIPHNGSTGQTGNDLHWIEFDSTGLVIADSGLLAMTLPAGITHMGDFGDIVIDLNGILYGSSSSTAANQLAGLFTADMNLAVPAVTVLNAAYTGAQLALTGNDGLYGNDWQTGEVVNLDKTNGNILSTATIDFGGDFFDMAPVSPHVCDWGDLADPPYATQEASNGPAHKIGVVGNVFLGADVDSELDGQPTIDGSGDGADEDGVLFLNPTLPGGVTDIEVEASGSGVLNAWIDFNSDGDFTDAGEQIASDVAVASGTNTLNNVAVPAGAIGVMAARFRITVNSGEGGGAPTGSADNGEVEDYVLSCIGSLVWNDLDGDGIQDGGAEVGVPGVTVTLLSPVFPFLPLVDGNGTLVTTTTDVNGVYEFCGLPTVSTSGMSNPGEYRVLFDRPAAFTDFSPANLGGDDTLDSDADQDTLGVGIEGLAPLDTLPAITLVANQVDDTIDAGLRAVTAVLITSAGAYADSGQVVFEFSTGYEALTGGFEVFRYVPELADYTLVTQRQVPALLGAPQGGVYRVVDETASMNSTLSYVIVEHQTDGRTHAYGPYRVAVSRREARAPADDRSAARPHKSSRLAARLAQAQERRAADANKTLVNSRAQGLLATTSKGLRKQATVQISVRESGLYRVTAEELAETLGVESSGVHSLLRSGRVAINNRGREIAWLPSGDSGDGLYFYGEAIDSLYSLDNVYQLRLGKAGKTMSTAKGSSLFAGRSTGLFTSTESFERDVIPAINSTLKTEIDHWYWAGINAASADTTRTFEVAVPDAQGGSATLRARFVGASNGGATRDHHAIVRVNGVEIGTAAWAGMNSHEAELVFTGDLLSSDTTIEIEGVLDGDSTESIFFIDGFDLEYERAYRAVSDSLLLTGSGNSEVTVSGFTSGDLIVLDLSRPTAPRVVSRSSALPGGDGYEVSLRPTNARTLYLATAESAARQPASLRRVALGTDLRAAHHRYDHVVIAPEAWAAEAEDLATHRSERGLRSMAVSLEEIYDTFSHGLATPWAIRDFLAYAQGNWSQGPDFAVLAGRGTLDPRDLLDGGDNHLPVVLVGTPYGLIPSDNVLADLTGNDSRPEIALGRLPIVSADELANYVAKLEAYGSAAGPWQGQALLLADNADAAGDFAAQSDSVGTLLSSYQQDTVYLSEMTSGEAREALLAAWNQGAQLINYVGHGGVTQAAAEGLLRASDMDALTNSERLPIVSALTCVLGRSDIPNLESLAEALVTDVDGGAIAVWAPSGVSLSGAAHELNLLYAAALESAPPATELGRIVVGVLNDFGAAGGLGSMLDTYGIVGDPAVQLP